MFERPTDGSASPADQNYLISHSTTSPGEAAALLRAHWRLGGTGVVLARPLPADVALNAGEFAEALAAAQRQARAEKVSGPALTPFLLARLAEASGGKTLAANRALIVANASLAAEIAVALCEEG